MSNAPPPDAAAPRATLVTDFDGTMTRHDVHRLITERLSAPDEPDHWGEHRAGRLSLFEALRRIFASVGGHDEAALLAVIEAAGLDPGLAGAVGKLADHGWEAVVASAGCGWYVRHLLDGAGVDLEVHANPGSFVPGEGLVMLRLQDSPFVSHDRGIDKAAVVRDRLARRERVAFAGDGTTDLDAARLVPAELRFARADLAAAAAAEGLEFRPFERWSQIVEVVVGL